MSLWRHIARLTARAEEVGLGLDIAGTFARHGDHGRWDAAFANAPIARTAHRVFGDTVVVGERREPPRSR